MGIHIKPPSFDKVKKHIENGIKYGNKGNLKKALQEFKKAIILDANNYEIYAELGLVYYRRGKLNEAVSEYKRAIELNPRSAEVFYRLGCAYFYLGKLDETVRYYKKAIEIKPNSPQAHYSLGITLEVKGEIQESLNEIQEAVKFAPNVKALVLEPPLMKKSKEGFDLEEFFKSLWLTLFFLLEKITSPLQKRIPRRYTSSKDEVENYIQRGIEYSRDGMLGKAISYFKKAITLQPTNYIAHNELGLTFYHLNLLDDAEEEFKKVIELNPNFVAGYYHLGCVYYQRNLLDKAIEYYKRTIEMDPNFAQGYYSLGVAYEKKGMVKEAFELTEKAVSMVPDIRSLVPTVRSYEEIKKREIKVSTPEKGGCLFALFNFFYLFFLNLIVYILEGILNRSRERMEQTSIYQNIERLKEGIKDYLSELEER